LIGEAIINNSDDRASSLVGGDDLGDKYKKINIMLPETPWLKGDVR